MTKKKTAKKTATKNKDKKLSAKKTAKKTATKNKDKKLSAKKTNEKKAKKPEVKATKSKEIKSSAKNKNTKPDKNKSTKTTSTMKKSDTKKTSKSNTKKDLKKQTKPVDTKAKGKSSSKDKDEQIKKSRKPVNKPKSKKEYEDDDELMDDDDILTDEDAESDDVTEVEEIDLSNIEPVITDAEPLLDDEEEEEYVPKTRGRKKTVQPETHHQQTMEEIIRNRPLQIDPTQKTYITKKENEPKPYIAPSKSNKERYSDKELQEFKKIILQKLEETKENYEQLKKYFTHKDDNGIDDTSPTFKMIEDGSDVMTKEEVEQQLARLEKYMVDLQNALLRIENKTYGICTVTGKLIPKERLILVPHATKSIEAKINRDA